MLFIILLVYFKIPQKVNELLSKMIEDIGKEIDESEKLRSESRSMLDKSQKQALNGKRLKVIKFLIQLKKMLKS